MTNDSLVWFAAFAAGLWFLLLGGWTDRWLRIRTPRFEEDGWSRLPADHLWPRLYLSPATAELHPDGGVPGRTVEWLGMVPHVRRRALDADGATVFEEHHLVQEIEPGRRVLARWSVVEGRRPSDPPGGLAALHLSDAGDGTRVRKMMQPDMAPWRVVALSWLDDRLGRLIDAQVRTAERLAAQG